MHNGDHIKVRNVHQWKRIEDIGICHKSMATKPFGGQAKIYIGETTASSNNATDKTIQ